MDINFITLLDIIKKGRKYFLIVFLVTFALSAAISFILPVYYASSTVLFPLSPRSYDPRSRFSNVDIYGSADDINRTIALAESGVIRDRVIKKYRLAQRYGIDTADRVNAELLGKEYQGNLEIKETNKGAIKITFYDKQPDTAAAIVNDIVTAIDSINKKVVEEAVAKQFGTYKKALLDKYAGMDSLNKILDGMRALDKNDPNREVTSMDMFQSYTRMKETEVNLQSIRDNIPTLLVIERGAPNWKKEKPKRMIIVALACLATFIITLFFLLYREAKRETV